MKSILVFLALCGVAQAELLAVKIADPAKPHGLGHDYGIYQWADYIYPDRTNWITFNDGPTLTDGLPHFEINDYFRVIANNPSNNFTIQQMGHDGGPQHVLFGTLGGETGTLNSIFTEEGPYSFYISAYGFGEEGHGEVWVLWEVAGERGDINGDGSLNALDIDAMRGPHHQKRMDFNGDGRYLWDDHNILVRDILGTTYGDANLDQSFDASDLIIILQSGAYETNMEVGWSEGDFNADHRFSTSDLMLALAEGGYEMTVPALSVPETHTSALFLLGIFTSYLRRKK